MYCFDRDQEAYDYSSKLLFRDSETNDISPSTLVLDNQNNREYETDNSDYKDQPPVHMQIYEKQGDHEIPVDTHIGKNPLEQNSEHQRNGQMNSHELRVLYCVSCSYKGNYQQFAQYFRHSYPDMRIEGGEYPSPPIKQLIANLLQYVQYGLFALLFAGDWIFAKLNIAPPAMYYQAKQKKMISFFVILFVGNSIIGGFQQTGGFEVYFDGYLIFSKLQAGRMPTVNEVEEAMLSRIDSQ